MGGCLDEWIVSLFSPWTVSGQTEGNGAKRVILKSGKNKTDYLWARWLGREIWKSSLFTIYPFVPFTFCAFVYLIHSKIKLTCFKLIHKRARKSPQDQYSHFTILPWVGLSQLNQHIMLPIYVIFHFPSNQFFLCCVSLDKRSCFQISFSMQDHLKELDEERRSYP